MATERKSPDGATHATDVSIPQDLLFAQCYERLKDLASRQLARGSGNTLDTTALVHELYLRVNRQRELAFEQPAQFFAYAVRAMRHLLADRARDRLRLKAGGDWIKVTLTGDSALFGMIENAEQALALEEALQRLEREDPRAARVVELHWFAGIGAEEIATMLGLARRTVDRDWRYARAFLHAALG